MRNNTLTALKLIILLLPFCVLSLLVVKAELSRNAAKIWTVDIEGFDPRDILHGQYLAFKFDWNWAAGQPEDCAACCVCLQENLTGAPSARIVSCETSNAALPQCGAVIRNWDAANTHSGKPFERAFRFYIPEQHANILQSKLNNFSPDAQKDRFAVRLNVTPQGQMMFRDLWMNGQPYVEGITAEK